MRLSIRLKRACQISERTGRGRCDLSRKTGNNDWVCLFHRLQTQENWRSQRVHLLYRNQRRKDTALSAPRGTLWPPVRLLSQQRQKVPTVHEAKHSEKPNWSSHRSRTKMAPSLTENPYSATESRQDPAHLLVPHLMIGRQASRFCAMFFVPACTFAVKTGGIPILLGRRDWTAKEIWVL